MIIVPPSGKSPNRVLVVGEAPGREEYERGEPFVGAAGREQNFYLSRHDLHSRYFRLTNVIQEYTEGNPDPSPEQIAYWTPHLEREIATCQPSIILAVGRFAARWFLGSNAELDDCHGIPHLGGEFDSTLAPRAHGAIVLPIYHPAYGLYSPEAKALINWDYTQFAYYLDLITRNKRHLITFRRDEYAGRETYLDVTGEQLADLLSTDKPTTLGLDTEGLLPNPWSVQVSPTPGTAYTLRTSQPDLSTGIRYLQHLVDSNCLIVTHDAGTPQGALHDTQICRAIGLELTDARTFNTMYAAFLLRTESKGLKSLAYRWCGMVMDDYMSLVAGIARDKQLSYLHSILARDWPKPETRIVRKPDGSKKPYTPKSIEAFALAIVRDIESGKLNKDGEVTDPYNRWMGGKGNKGIDRVLRATVESTLGPIPTASLNDVELSKAITYACSDPDATLRLLDPLTDQLRKNNLLPLMSTGMAVLPIFEEMQRVGMPASRSQFLDLAHYVDARMQTIQERISTLYNDGQPFNAGSPKQVAELMSRRGLKGEKKTKTGTISTGKKSIEHLKHTDSAIADIIEWREHAKIATTYAYPLLDIADEQATDKGCKIDDDNPYHCPHCKSKGFGEELDGSGRCSFCSGRENGNYEPPDLFTVHCKLKPVTVVSRRLSAEDPSLLNVPVRTELGRRVRMCYRTFPHETFSAHDFSGQEARVAAHVCNSRLMIRLFSHCRHCGEYLDQSKITNDRCDKSDSGKHEGGDIHAETATRVFGVKPGDVDKETYKYKYRMPAKTGFFGILNGMEGPGLLDQFRMYIPPEFDPDGYWSNLDNCTALVTEIKRKVYPELYDTSEAVLQEIKRTGLVRDLYGMMRYLPQAWSRDRKEVAEAGRQGFNHIIQGTAQGMMQNALVWLRPHLRDLQRAGLYVYPALPIHDELIMRIDPWLWPVVDQLVSEAFTCHYGLKLKVPVEVDGHMANNWSDLK